MIRGDSANVALATSKGLARDSFQSLHPDQKGINSGNHFMQ